MAPKRKMEIIVVDENERVRFSTFQNVANNLCQLYSQASVNQKLAFEAGQHSSYVQMHEWITAKLQEGKLLTVLDILRYVQEHKMISEHESKSLVLLAEDKRDVPMTGHTEQQGCGTDQNGATTSHTSPSSTQPGISYPDIHMETNIDVTMD